MKTLREMMDIVENPELYKKFKVTYYDPTIDEVKVAILSHMTKNSVQVWADKHHYTIQSITEQSVTEEATPEADQF
jgi:hypothetical protein